MLLPPPAQARKALTLCLGLNFLFELQLMPQGKRQELLPELFGLIL